MSTHVQQVCKPGHGEKCCKYLVMGIEGWECMKVTNTKKALIDKEWAKNHHTAQGDNCEGKSDLKR